MTNKFVSIMETIGRDALKALAFVVEYLPKVTELASLIFPQEAAALNGVVNATQLIQNAVVTVEQKMAAGGKATGTGAQKLADVLQIVTPTVTQLLAAEGIKADTAYITNLVNVIVGILNVRQMTPTGNEAVPA